tara:strand:- start:1539 stop:2540 length:1002 start_codon:yes stop_codon:yes gene_type:complete
MKTQYNRAGYIDSLRAIAILLVVLFHYTYHYENEYLLRTDQWKFELARYGWSGVDIFFIVSGYCIGMTIIKTKNFFEFVIRRVARLYPGYLICGLLTLIFYSYFDLPGREVDWFTGFMNLIFANFLPGMNFKYIDGIYWALMVEIKFYLFFGLLFFLLNSLKKSIHAWFIFCLLGNIISILDKNSFIFITSIFPHANLFLIGLMIFYFDKISTINKLIVFLFVIISLLTNERYAGFELYFIILVSLVSIFLLKKIDFNIKILSSLGLISYTWYLTHNAIGIIIIRELNNLNFQNISIILATIITLFLSIIIHRFFEIRFKKEIIELYKKIFQK